MTGLGSEPLIDAVVACSFVECDDVFVSFEVLWVITLNEPSGLFEGEKVKKISGLVTSAR